MTDLRIVQPECDILSQEAKTLAVGSIEILQNAKIYQTLGIVICFHMLIIHFKGEAIADLDRVIVTSARPRNINQKIYTPKDAIRESISVENVFTNIGIVFGREKNGLTNEGYIVILEFILVILKKLLSEIVE